MNKRKNNRGQITAFLIIMIIAVVLVAIFLFVSGVVSIKINDALNQSIMVGQVNLSEENDKYFGKFNTMFLNSADWWGLSAIFGLVIGLFLSAYFTRNKFPRWGLVIDVFLIVAFFILSLYISSSYTHLLDALAGAGETFLEDYTPKTSLFIKNLPIFEVIIGVICMVLFHSAIPRKSEEGMQQGGFLQGVQ